VGAIVIVFVTGLYFALWVNAEEHEKSDKISTAK